MEYNKHENDCERASYQYVIQIMEPSHLLEVTFADEEAFTEADTSGQ